MHDIAIIGAGPAGMTAAIQLTRAGFTPTLIERHRAGGLLHNANLVENYPPFGDGIAGPALVERFVRHTQHLGIAIHRATVTEVRREGDHYRLVFDLGPESSRLPTDYRAVIVATGTVPNPLPLLEDENDPAILSRIYYEVTDLPTDERGPIAVIGGGDAALDYALNIASSGRRAIVLCRRAAPTALPLLVRRIEQEPRIELRSHTRVCDIETAPQGLRLSCASASASAKEDERRSRTNEALEVAALLVAIGRQPTAPAIFDASGRRLDFGTNLAPDGSTPLPALHFCGDVRRGRYRQVGIAVGDALIAAMAVARQLRSLR